MKNIAIEKIQPNDYNPNEMTDTEFQECKNEVKYLGAIPKPVIVRPHNGVFIIVDGEHNWRAARDLGFTAVPCEVMDIDDLEAMRQTYKRNMHGTFNPGKLGEMFKVALKKSGISQRELAKQYAVSDGTIRNALMYCEAKELRSGYAFEQLGVRQLRIYITLPAIIRDKWLDAGADSKLLLPDRDLKGWEKMMHTAITDESFDDIEAYVQRGNGPDASYFKRYADIDKWQLGDLVSDKRAEFKQSVERISAFMNWIYWELLGQREEDWTTFKDYALLMFPYFDDKDIGKEQRKKLVKTFRLIRYKDKVNITLEEFAKIFEDSFSFGCEKGYRYQFPQYVYIDQSIQVLLIEKGIIEEPVDAETLPDPASKLIELRVNKDAPEWLKQITIPAIAKAAILDHKMSDFLTHPIFESPVTEEAFELAKQETAKELERKFKESKYYTITPSSIQHLIDGNAFVVKNKQENDAMDKPGLASTIAGWTKLYSIEDNVAELESLVKKLVALKREELLAIYKIMDSVFKEDRIKKYFKHM